MKNNNLIDMFKISKSEQKSVLDCSIDLSTLKTTNTTLDFEKYKKVFKVSSSNEKKLLNNKRFKTTLKYSQIQSTSNPKNSHGLWDKSEHDKYIEGLYIYNCDWCKISKYMGNRTHYQIVSHSQKFFLRLKNFKDDELGLDFTSDFVNSLKQIVYMVKEKEESLNMNKKLLYIISEKISFGKKIKRKKGEELSSEAKEDDFDLCPGSTNEDFSYNFIHLNKEEENKNDIINSSEINYLDKDDHVERDMEEMSLVNIDNRNNFIFLQL